MSGPWVQSVIFCLDVYWWQHHLEATPANTIILLLHEASDLGKRYSHLTGECLFPAFIKRLPETPYGSVSLELLSHFFNPAPINGDEHCWPVMFCPPLTGSRRCDCHITSVCGFKTGPPRAATSRLSPNMCLKGYIMFIMRPFCFI